LALLILDIKLVLSWLAVTTVMKFYKGYAEKPVDDRPGMKAICLG
jgi:hypothetical protein